MLTLDNSNSNRAEVAKIETVTKKNVFYLSARECQLFNDEKQ